MAKKGAKLVSVTQALNPFTLMEDFLFYKKSKGVSKATLSSFRSAIKNFLTGYKGSIKDEKKLRQAIDVFLIGRSNGYYNKLLQALRQFMEYCQGEGLLHTNPCAGISHRRESTRIVEHNLDTIKRLLDIPDRTTFAGLRDYIFMILVLDTGARPSELLRIRVKDIDFVNMQINIRAEYAKTGIARDIPISPQSVNCLKKIIEHRHEAWSKDVPVLCSFSGNELSTHNLREKFLGYSKKLGIRITPYHLRHVFAIMFIRNQGNIFALQKIMGHSKLDMTRVYVNLVQADIAVSHRKATPLNGLFIANNRIIKI